jgi:hypothetical protein
VAVTLTLRHGASVARERFETVEAAIEAARERVREVRSGGGLGTAKGFRDYEPGERVQARIELSAGGPLRGRNAGLDVMGDGTLVPYAGAIFKRRLETGGSGDEFDALLQAME